MTIEPTPIKGIEMSSAVITRIEGEWDIVVKDEESRDII
jgi:hypothetical protein